MTAPNTAFAISNIWTVNEVNYDVLPYCFVVVFFSIILPSSWTKLHGRQHTSILNPHITLATSNYRQAGNKNANRAYYNSTHIGPVSKCSIKGMFVGLKQVLDVSKTFNLENFWLFLNHFSVKGKEQTISLGCTLWGLHTSHLDNII